MNLHTHANTVLDYGVTNGRTFWKTGILEAYPGEKEKASAAIGLCESKLQKMGITKPVGSFPGSPHTLVSLALGSKTLPSQASVLIRLLKDNGRIIQVGGGHGKATLIISADHLEEGNQSLSVSRSDGSALVESIRDLTYGYEQDIKVLSAEVEDKTREIAELKARVDSLNDQLKYKDSISWA